MWLLSTGAARLNKDLKFLVAALSLNSPDESPLTLWEFGIKLPEEAFNLELSLSF